MNRLTILMAQINPSVGSIEYNTQKILQTIKQFEKNHDLIIFPEMCITGYPPEDILLHPSLYGQIQLAIDKIKNATSSCYVIIGYPSAEHNTAAVIHQGEIIHTYHKQRLPNEGVFDEKRYFIPGQNNNTLFNIKSISIGLCICEDLWQVGPVESMIENNAELIISINASPFDHSKHQKRIQRLTSLSKMGAGMIYVNQVGGQDELVFDGRSLAIDSQGTLCVQSNAFVECYESIIYQNKTFDGYKAPAIETIDLIYHALTCGINNYILKNNFKSVILGLSGGIDSALTLALAVDAIGADNVHALLLPSRYNAQESLDDAILQAQTLGVDYTILSIEPLFCTAQETLSDLFHNKLLNITQENIQARIRGMLLMAYSNNTHALLLTTSNKSEAATGYCTLYGDMCGGFSPLKDILKTQIYQLAHYRNSISAVIPERVITRPPSAELAPNQKDQDSLPDYAILDAIIIAFVENKLSISQIINMGYPQNIVERVITLIQKNEYKRRQSAPGIKISTCSFDRDWRYPITSHFDYNN